jgi:hypothetical protein
MNTDQVLAMDPMLSIIDTGGSNGEDDVVFKKILRTERFYVDLPNSGLLPQRHRSVYVVERIFEENYENIYMSWFAQMADGTTQNPYKFVGLHETSHEHRREPEEYVGSHNLIVPQSTIDAFRLAAARQLSIAQRKALDPPKPKRKYYDLPDEAPVDIMQQFR